MSEPGGRRRAEPRSETQGGGLFGGSRPKRSKGGKRAARPGLTDTQSIPAFVEFDLPEVAAAPVAEPAPAPTPVAEPTPAPAPAPATVAAPSRRARRAAARQEKAARQAEAPAEAPSGAPTRTVARPAPPRRPAEVAPVPASELVVWSLAVALGFAILVLGNGFNLGPRWVGGMGSLIVTIAYIWVLVSRTGGRPLIGCAVTTLGGALTLILDRPELNTGAAAIVAAAAAVLGVVITVPAVGVLASFREAIFAIVVALGGAVAAVGWRPEVDLIRFEYAVLMMAVACAFTLVFRLGAGLHGLGRRGAVIVLFGAGVLLITLLYAEALRHWADVGLVGWASDAVGWSRDHLGAFPRPMVAVLGVPALAWGTHMRARRRQGWWVCAFGVAGTSAVAISLMNAELGAVEVGLSILYGVVIGLAIGYAIIRADLALTGSGRGRPAVGRRGRRSEERENAVRPEPKRTAALL